MTVQVDRQNGHARGDGFAVISNEEVALSSKGDSKLPVRPRRIGIFRDEDAKTIAVIANDTKRAAFDSRNTVTLTFNFRFRVRRPLHGPHRTRHRPPAWPIRNPSPTATSTDATRDVR